MMDAEDSDGARPDDDEFDRFDYIQSVLDKLRPTQHTNQFGKIRIY